MGLAKQYRLKDDQQFQVVFKQNQKIVTPLFILLLHYKSEKSGPRFGIVASKKVGGAVQRNRAKRLMREAISQLIPQIKKNIDVIIICRSEILEVKTPAVQATLHKIPVLFAEYATKPTQH
jgi:ribonuclease P protein component